MDVELQKKGREQVKTVKTRHKRLIKTNKIVSAYVI